MYKIFVAVILLIIVASLFSGLFYLIRDKGHSKRTVQALTWRISLSLGLFVMLMLGYATGLLQPRGSMNQPVPEPPASSVNQ